MSNASSTAANDDLSVAVTTDPGVLASAVRRTITAPLQFVGFWAAVALPFLYLPLVYDGLQGTEATVFLGLLAVNVLGLVLGHSHNQD